MIEKLIEDSIRNRFLVLILAGALAAWAVYAVLNTPVDAMPDLSENQVIVFTDWMGRSPQEIEDQVTYPLSLKLQGLAGVKAVRSSSEFNFSMITHDLRGQHRLLLRPPARAGAADAGQHLPAGGRHALPGSRRHGPGPDLLVHARRRRPRPRPPLGLAEVLRRPGDQLRARRGRGRRRRRHAAGVPDRRRPQRPARLRHHPGRAVRRRGPQQLGRRRPGRSRRTTPSTWSAASAGSRVSRTSRTRSSPSAAARRSTSRTWRRCSWARSSAAASSRRTATRWSAAPC